LIVLQKGKVKISIYEYIDKLLSELLPDMEGTSKNPVESTNAFFQYNTEAKKLSEERAHMFHHLVAKLLYLCRRTQHYIQKAVAFLCTLVQKPDEDNYKAHTILMHYPRGTHELTLTIEPKQLPKLVCG